MLRHVNKNYYQVKKILKNCFKDANKILKRDRSFSKGEVLMAGSQNGPGAGMGVLLRTGHLPKATVCAGPQPVSAKPTLLGQGVSFQGTKSSWDKSQAFPECLLNLQAKLKF